MENISQPIIILSSPRCGSNLLMHSLAQHPDAVCGGEWHCPEEIRCDPEHWKNRHEKRCNLIKVCTHEAIPFDGLIVGLYRKDRQAQLASWKKACITGEWIAGSRLDPVDFPENAYEVIESTETRIHKVCDLIYSYEDMVKNWETAISIILHRAGWQDMFLPIATTKQ